MPDPLSLSLSPFPLAATFATWSRRLVERGRTWRFPWTSCSRNEDDSCCSTFRFVGFFPFFRRVAKQRLEAVKVSKMRKSSNCRNFESFRKIRKYQCVFDPFRNRGIMNIFQWELCILINNSNSYHGKIRRKISVKISVKLWNVNITGNLIIIVFVNSLSYENWITLD